MPKRPPMPMSASPSQVHLHPVPTSPARSLSPPKSPTQPAAAQGAAESGMAWDHHPGGARLPTFGEESPATHPVERRSDSPLGSVIQPAMSSTSGASDPSLDQQMARALEQARKDLPADVSEAKVLQRTLAILTAHYERTADAPEQTG